MKRLLLTLFLTGCSSGSFHFENDLFSGRRTDQFYTQGTALTYAKETTDVKETYTLGQNIYTPSRKRPDADPAVLKNDRPYSGWLYGEYRNTKFTAEYQKDTYGIQIGCSGPCSFARQTQQQFHRLIGQGQPTWPQSYQQKNEPGIILELERSYRLAKFQYSDIAAYGAGKAGNIIDSAAFGIDARAGYNLDKFALEPIIFKGTKDIIPPNPWIAYLFARVEERIIGYNHFLDGSLFHSERHSVSSEPAVQEGNLGVTVGYKKFHISYRYTIFSNEWRERQGSFSFAALEFNW